MCEAAQGWAVAEVSQTNFSVQLQNHLMPKARVQMPPRLRLGPKVGLTSKAPPRWRRFGINKGGTK